MYPKIQTEVSVCETGRNSSHVPRTPELELGTGECECAQIDLLTNGFVFFFPERGEESTGLE